MLSSLSSLADRNFIVGFLLPTLIAAVLASWLFQGYVFVAPVWEVVRKSDGLASLTLFVLAVWSLATLLSVFGIQLHRMLEGYFGPLSGEARSARYKARFGNEQVVLDGLMRKVDAGEFDRGQYLKRYARFLQDYPLAADYVMPSRFGNVLSAMETYSLEQYGADGAALWPRLIAVMPDGYQKVVDGGRAEVDFFVTSVYLALALSLLCLVSFAWSAYAQWHDGTPAGWGHLIAGLAFVLAAVMAYEGAIIRARGWGSSVRSAYDMFLSELAKRLGYEEPLDPQARKAFWTQLSSMVVYATPVDAKYRAKPAPPPKPGP